MAYDRFDLKTHAGVLSFFNQHYIKTDKIEKAYAKIIARAEKIRIKSDYDDFYMVSKQQAGPIERCREIPWENRRIHKQLMMRSWRWTEASFRAAGQWHQNGQQQWPPR